MSKVKFLYSGDYRREVMISRPFKGFYQKIKLTRSKRSNDPTMQIDFPSADQIGKLKGVVDSAELALRDGKNVVDSAELILRGGGTLSDAAAAAKDAKALGENGLRAWETAVTLAKSGNMMGEGWLAAQSLAESIVEWKKGHYICCVCSGIACSCFFVGAVAGLFPNGYGAWQAATQAGATAKGVTMTCRKITGGKGL